jgi:hypothetical protein
VKWFVAPLLGSEGIKQKIGNAPFLIIFNDSEEAFDPTNLYLGPITTIVCVVQYLANIAGYRYVSSLPSIVY